MHKRLIIVLCWLITGSATIAQVSEKTPSLLPAKEWLVKLAPLAVLEADGGIGVTGEYVLPKYKTGFQLDVQPIWFDVYSTKSGQGGFDTPHRLRMSGMPLGIKLRPEVRFYFKGFNSGSYYPHLVRAVDGTPLYTQMEARTYVAIDFLFKQTWTQRQGELPVYSGGTQPAYQQLAIYTDVKQVTGGDIKLGTLFPISQRNNWWLELYFGIGLRNKRFWYRHLPVGTSNPARSTIGFPHPGTDETGIARQQVPSFPAGIKLVYRFLKI